MAKYLQPISTISDKIRKAFNYTYIEIIETISSRNDKGMLKSLNNSSKFNINSRNRLYEVILIKNN